MYMMALDDKGIPTGFISGEGLEQFIIDTDDETNMEYPVTQPHDDEVPQPLNRRG